MNENKSTAATRAKNKYNKNNYERLYPYAKKGKKEVYRQAAASAGVSLNDFIIAAIEEKIEREKNNE